MPIGKCTRGSANRRGAARDRHRDLARSLGTARSWHLGRRDPPAGDRSSKFGALRGAQGSVRSASKKSARRPALSAVTDWVEDQL